MIYITGIFGPNRIYSPQIIFTMEKIVMMLKKLQLIFILVLSGFGLVACGDSDTAPAPAPAPAPAEEPKAVVQSENTASSISSSVSNSASDSVSNGGLEAYDPDVPSMVVEDNGVISEEEIYSNWPQ
jgi:hypothetical protein